MPQHVRVVPPDPAWAEGYRRERALLMPVFGPLLVELHHIGSTAVESEEPTMRNSNLLPVKAKGEVRFRSVASFLIRGTVGTPK